MGEFLIVLYADQVEAEWECSNRTSWFSTQDAFNPAIHRIKQAIFHSAVVADVTTNPIPPPHNDLLKYFTPPSRVLKKAKEPLENCIKAFGVKQGLFLPSRIA